MSQPTSDSKPALHPEVQWNLRKRLPSFLFAITLAGIGGFVGGYLTSYGPQYLNIHVTEAYPASDAERINAEPMPQALLVEPPPPPTEVETDLVASAVLPSGAEARLVMQGKNRSYLVLDNAPDASWGKGVKKVRGEDFAFTLSQALAPEHTTPELEVWRGRELTLYGAAGYACSARVADFELLQKSFEDGDDGSNVVREFLEGHVHLVAKLQPIRGACKSALWARDASLPPPALGKIARPERSLRLLAQKSFRQSAAWQDTQERFVKEGHRGLWDTLFDSKPSIRAMRGAAEELILVSANTAFCGEFDGTLSMLFRVEPDGSLAQLDSEALFLGDILASADIDGDGDLDFLGSRENSETLLVKQAAALVIESSSRALINYCGC